MVEKQLTLPLQENMVVRLRAGDVVLLSGKLYTARDAAHQRLTVALDKGKQLPFPPENQVIYYVGPAPAKTGQIIGPAGPTTSGRMDPYTLPLLAAGIRGLIGKGTRSSTVKQALIDYKAVYFAAVGGAAALLSRQIKQNRIIAYADLGTEAIRELVVENFPVIVVNDCLGGDAYVDGRARFGRPRKF